MQAEDFKKSRRRREKTLKAIRKRKAALDWAMKPELDPYATPERRKAAKEKVAHLQQSYAKIVYKERTFGEKLDIKLAFLKK